MIYFIYHLTPPQCIYHYGKQAVCRVSGTLDKGPNTLGKAFAECNIRQTTLGKQTDGEATFAECLFSGTRQNKKNTRQRKAKRPAQLLLALPSVK